MPQFPDYKATLRLPQTSFAIKPDKNRIRAPLGAYEKMASGAGELFILHDGPPYANGHLHMGHALNKVLKDIALRSQYMLGKRINYVPGWDCHGLPIEWKIEEQYRAQGKQKEFVPLLSFRQQCRAFAQEWIDIQSQEFQALGITGDWQNPYTTMSPEAEACIVGAFLDLVEAGHIYRGLRPVMWSTVEQTALAEAEIEYRERASPTLFVRFPLVDQPKTSAVIWTTTPWTIPANRMLAYAPHLTYGLYESGDGYFILATKLADAFSNITQRTLVFKTFVDLANKVCHHPLYNQGYNQQVPMHPADFVTDDTGTGLVHIAPEHGPDDYNLAMAHDIPIPTTIGPDGMYLPHIPLFAGLAILNGDGTDGPANGTVIKALIEAGMIVSKGKLRHSYPHSWRSKAPLIYRTTEQFFMRLDTHLRTCAHQALENVKFMPETGRQRLQSMIENRPDWVVSRQRLWGVPLGIFIHKKTSEMLINTAVNARIVASFKQKGSDIWFAQDERFFLEGLIEDWPQWQKVPDILDVWFDSGCSQNFFLRQKDLFPADLYLEGSDQHRGWFQSSLLCACASKESAAPFKSILTHGFVVDEAGKKMSKSQGNVLSPEKIIAQYGVDVLRVWIASCDYAEDLRIGPNILVGCSESYRKIRNTIRYLIGNLNDYVPDTREVPMPPLERWVLHKLALLSPIIQQAYARFDFKKVFHTLLQFAVHNLSSFYFDIRKDCLYCDDPLGPKRRACQKVLKHLLDALITWLDPIIPFMTQEARQCLSTIERVQIQTAWLDSQLDDQWEKIRHVRKLALVHLEQARKNGLIGSSLEACLHITLSDNQLYEAVHQIDLAEVCITSQATVVQGKQDLIDVTLAVGLKCARCWKFLPDVTEQGEYPYLCNRDRAIVQALKITAS